MSFESLNQFFQEISQDPSQQQQLVQSAIDGESLVNKVVELGKEKGYDFTQAEAQDWIEAASAQMESQPNTERELNDEELESVAGGWTPFAPIALLFTTVLARGAIKVGGETIKN